MDQDMHDNFLIYFSYFLIHGCFLWMMNWILNVLPNKNISAVSSDNAAFDNDDEENQFLPNEEEVYQDLVKIQNNIARNQVLILYKFILCTPLLFLSKKKKSV
jgi:hypothetical protein